MLHVRCTAAAMHQLGLSTVHQLAPDMFPDMLQNAMQLLQPAPFACLLASSALCSVDHNVIIEARLVSCAHMGHCVLAVMYMMPHTQHFPRKSG